MPYISLMGPRCAMVVAGEVKMLFRRREGYSVLWRYESKEDGSLVVRI